MPDKIRKFVAGEHSLHLSRELGMTLLKDLGPFDRKEDFTLNMVTMNRDAPHNGEMHPDGDEFVFVLEGVVEATLELVEGTETVLVEAGEGIVIPKGIWHKFHLLKPGRLLTIAPGPGFEFKG